MRCPFETSHPAKLDEVQPAHHREPPFCIPTAELPCALRPKVSSVALLRVVESPQNRTAWPSTPLNESMSPSPGPPKAAAPRSESRSTNESPARPELGS